MYIGEISRKTGVSVKAIRLYQEMGLLPEVGRKGVYRVFNENHIQLIFLIKEAKNLGFRLSELKSVFGQNVSTEPWKRILDLLHNKKKEIDSEVKALTEAKSKLESYENMIKECLSKSPSCKFPK